MIGADSSRFISKAAFRAMSGTLVSRLTGMLRDVIMAYTFGASSELAVFLLAYRFVYFIRRLFGESLLHQGFIPQFEALRLVDPPKAARFFRDLMASLVVVLVVFILVGEFFLGLCSGQVAYLMQWMLPGTLFLCLFGLTSGLLNSEKSFFIPAVSPAVFNIIWIIGVLWVANYPVEHAIFFLTLVISTALVVQFSVTLPKVWNYLRSHLVGKEVWRCQIFSKNLTGLSAPLFLGVVGVAAVQLNSVIDGVFSRFAALEGPAYLWYAIRMQQLPLALFGLAFTSAVFPSLSRAYEKKKLQEFESLIHTSIAKVLYFLIPCTVGIFVLGASSVNLLFGRGDFGALAVTQTTLCLWGYGIGLVPMALTQLLATTFYARKDYRTPAYGFLITVILNVLLNSVLVFGFKIGAPGVAFSTSGVAFFNVFFLKRFSDFQIAHSYFFSMLVVICGFITAITGIAIKDATFGIILGSPCYPCEFFEQLLQFSILVFVFFGSFFLLLKGIFRDQWKSIREILFSS